MGVEVQVLSQAPEFFNCNIEASMNEHIVEDLTRLRDELAVRAFTEEGRTKDSALAEVVFKINSCLGKGYPRRKQEQK